MKIALLLIALSGSASLLPTSSHAQEDVTAPSSLEALIEQGISLRRSGQDRDALRSFQQAERLSPQSARVQAHLAGTYQALGDWLRADEYLATALSQTGDAFVQRHRDTLEQARQGVEEHIGRLDVEGTPAGAEVRLDGRLEGTLPLRGPIRTVAGAYTLQVDRPGFYGVRRSVTLLGGGLTRETIQLAPEGAPAEPNQAQGGGSREADATSSWSPGWLTWTLGGLGVGAATMSVVSWLVREQRAEHWNDDARCLRTGQTREEVCGGERAASERAETAMLLGAAATGVFMGGAVLTVVLGDASSQSEPPPAIACGLDGLGATCAARF